MHSKTIQGVEVPEIGLGTYKLLGKAGEQALKTALSLGYRHIDTAQDYKNEKMIGAVIKQSHVDRDDLFVTTKVALTNLEPKKLLETTEQSLVDLEMDYVDLLLIHWPTPTMDLSRTLDAMLTLRDQGKVTHLGVSNFPVGLLEEAQDEISQPIFCNQVEYHPLLGQFDLLDYAGENDMMLTAYSPLGQGNVLDIPLLNELGEKYGKSASQIALRWLIEQEQVVVIPKASSREHLEQNMDVYDFELEDEDFYAIDDLDKTRRFINPDFAPDWDY